MAFLCVRAADCIAEISFVPTYLGVYGRLLVSLDILFSAFFATLWGHMIWFLLALHDLKCKFLDNVHDLLTHIFLRLFAHDDLEEKS